MKKIISLVALGLSGAALSAPTYQWLTVDSAVLAKVQPKLTKSAQILSSENGATIMRLNRSEVETLSSTIHQQLHRCGGFISHDSLEEAQAAISHQSDMSFAQRAIFADYSLTEQSTVNKLMPQIQEASILDMINKLTNFKTRYYKTQTGVQSSEFIRDTWAQLAKRRSDVKVELFKHSDWPQASIIMTIPGSEKPEEIVIIGGHADSISGMFGGNSRAPGADDNASGIATITETIRVLMANDFKPKRTVQFMGYAAEEVGLLGSKDIVKDYASRSSKVIGVIQFDMTLRKGTADKNIVMMADFTNQAQNEFLGTLIDTYVKVPWGYSRCGYGCSDHASWTAKGYPASMPFESTMEDINHNIHTPNDTVEKAGGDASHAVPFAKLATAFIVELSN